MKKYHNFPVILTIILVGIVVLSFVKIHGDGVIVPIVVCAVIYAAALMVYFGNVHEKKSFENPSTLSENDAGKMFLIKELKGDRAGLVTFGYNERGIGQLQDYMTYFYISGIPVELREINMVFKIVQSKEGLIFKMVKVNGFSDETKEPFEVLQPVYSLS